MVLCTLVATATSAARLLLLLMLVLSAALVLCLASLAKGQLLVRTVVNPTISGPRDWPDHARLCRIYWDVTWACVAIGLLNGAAQLTFSLRDAPAALAILHAISCPVFGAAATIASLRAAGDQPQVFRN